MGNQEMPIEGAESITPTVPRTRRRRRQQAPRQPAPQAAAPRVDTALSPETIAAIAAQVAAVFAQPGGPRLVVPPSVAAAPRTDMDPDGEDFDPLNPKVQAAARARLNRGNKDVPRARGLSDEEVLAMFQEEELGEFDVPREVMLPGQAYGWKLKSVVGKENSGYEAELRRRGWVNVLHEDHPGAFGLREETGPIIRKGLQLMRRPVEMEELRQRYHRLLAKQAVRDKLAQMSQAPAGTGPRTHKDVAPRISRTYEPLPVE